METRESSWISCTIFGLLHNGTSFLKSVNIVTSFQSFLCDPWCCVCISQWQSWASWMYEDQISYLAGMCRCHVGPQRWSVRFRRIDRANAAFSLSPSAAFVSFGRRRLMITWLWLAGSPRRALTHGDAGSCASLRQLRCGGSGRKGEELYTSGFGQALRVSAISIYSGHDRPGSARSNDL